MIRFKPALATVALTLALHAQATTVALPTNGTWMAFDVDVVATGSTSWIDAAYNGDFSPLSFSFQVAAGEFASLTVVDGGHAGDRFTLALNGNASFTTTSVGSNNFPANLGLDFDTALSDPAYSRANFTLGPGSYTLTGSLLQSALDGGGVAIDATVGGVRLTVSPVPEPATALTLLTGLGLLSLRRRRA